MQDQPLPPPHRLGEDPAGRIGPGKGPAEASSRWPRTLLALRHRNFRLYWSGQVLSQIGTWMQIVAQGWLVYRLTDSPLMLGLVTVMGLLPVLPLSLLAGVLSDRFSRKNLIIATETVLMLQALILAYLTWSGVVQVWHVIVLSFVLGGAAALEQPARLAFVVDTVGKEDLSNAVALNSAVYNAARIIGPAIAGLLVAWMGEAGCFLINGVSYLPVILAMAAIRLPFRQRPKEKLQVVSSLAGGFRYTWDTRTIRSLLLIVALSSFFTLPYITLMPVFARDVLSAGAQGLGFLMTAIGVGAIGGALFVANVEAGRRGKWLMAGNLLGPAFLLLFCLSQSFAASLVIVVLVGASNAVRQTLANSLIQITTSEKYHGRVMSLFNLMFNGMSRTGALGIGAVAELTGVPLALGASAVVSLVLSVAMLRGMPEVWRIS